MKDSVRLARVEDIPRIVAIRAAVRENKLSDPSRVTHADIVWFIAAQALFVWDDHDGISGFSAGDPRDGSIWALFVDPSCEGLGIGKALLAAACDLLRQAGHREAHLTTDTGTRAEAFYQQQGWQPGEIDARGERVMRRVL